MVKCKDDPQKLSAIKLGEHIQPGFTMSTILSFKYIKNKYYIHRGELCIKKFRKSSKKHGRKIINFKKKKNEVIEK